MLTQTAQMRLLYLADLRAHRHGDLTSGIRWERADHGPFNKSVRLLPRKVDIGTDSSVAFRQHATAVVEAYARLSNDDLGFVVKGTAPMRKAPRRGDMLDLDATSTNDSSVAVTSPAD